MNDFQKGIMLALKEPGWQKFIKIPHSEIVAYVELMKHFEVEVDPKTLKKFRPSQIANFKAKRKTSYSYILTFELLQDLKKAKTINELLTLWELNSEEKIEAGKMLAGLLTQQAKPLISGSASIGILDVFKFFANPKVQAKGFEKVLGLSIGRLAGGVGLFVTPNILQAPKVLDIPRTGIFAPVVPNEMTFTEADADKIEKEIALDKEADRLLAEAQDEIDLDKEVDKRLAEAEKEIKKNKKDSWKKKATKQVIKKGIPVGILGLLLKKGIDTFGSMAPFALAYMALDTLENKKGKK